MPIKEKVLLRNSHEVREFSEDGRSVCVRVSYNYQIRTEMLPEDKFVRLVLLDERFPTEEEELIQERINDLRATPKNALIERALDEYLRLYKIDDPRVIDTTLKAA